MGNSKKEGEDMAISKMDEKTARKELIRKITKQVFKENDEGFRRLSKN